MTLSVARAHAAGPSRCRESRRSRAAPARCRPRRRGRASPRTPRPAPASRSRGIRSVDTSMGTTSWPSRPRASSTRAPERSETDRSSERPPLSTTTRLTCAWRGARGPRRMGAGARARPRSRSRRRVVVRAPARRPPPGERPVQLHLLGHDLADATDPLADLVVVAGGEAQPQRVAAAAVEVGGLARHEGHVLAQRAREQVGGVDEVGERDPHEQAAGGVRPLGLRREVLGQGVEHRVAPAAVERRRARPRSRASGPARSTPAPSAARGWTCRGPWPACRG